MRINRCSEVMLMLCLSLASTSLFSQEAYKWVDEQGKVHYGDKPPQNASNPVPVAIKPGPTQDQKQEAEEIQQKRVESAEAYETTRETRETSEAEEAKHLANEEKAKEQKQELMHVATCVLLSQEDYYLFDHNDEEGWPHYVLSKELPDYNLEQQEEWLKRLIITYFEQV